MSVTLTLSLAPETVERLRLLAEASGETIETVAVQALEELAEDVDVSSEGALGDDAELARRIAAWRADPVGVPADEVHAWLRSLGTDRPLPEPKPRRR